MTAREDKVIRNYLIKADVEHMEFYEELYDHIASSYSARSDKTENIEQHLEKVISPEFGGTDGISEMVRKQGKYISKQVYKEAWKVFKNYFITPKGLIVSLAIISLLYFVQSTINDNLLVDIGLIFFLLPAGIAGVTQLLFKRKCKKEKLPYKTSIVNTTVFGISTFALGFLQGLPDILHRIFLGSRFNTITYLSTYDFITLPLTFLLTLYVVVSITLVYKKVKLKPQVN